MAEGGEFERVDSAASVVAARIGVSPRTAIVLGSGLGEFSERLVNPVEVPYEDIPHWPASTVVGHAGRLVAGICEGRVVVALSGRAHLYEGHEPARVVFATRVMWRLGVRRLLLTNAAGGINSALSPGTLMVIDDHINLLGANPLGGAHDERFGVRFPDMSEVYSSRLRGMADEVAAGRGITVAHGVYAAVQGPSYETPAEIRYLRTIGADAVGMSTVPEAIAARHLGLEVLALSCISNMAAGILARPLVHDEVMTTARQSRDAFAGLIEGIIARLD